MVQGVVQEEPPLDTRTLYLNHPVLRDSASQLLTISTKVVGPIGLLYVCQREMAVTVAHDSTYINIQRNLIIQFFHSLHNVYGCQKPGKPVKVRDFISETRKYRVVFRNIRNEYPEFKRNNNYRSCYFHRVQCRRQVWQGLICNINYLL